jgi:hypothetical protein
VLLAYCALLPLSEPAVPVTAMLLQLEGWVSLTDDDSSQYPAWAVTAVPGTGSELVISTVTATANSLEALGAGSTLVQLSGALRAGGPPVPGRDQSSTSTTTSRGSGSAVDTVLDLSMRPHFVTALSGTELR